jgi:hypothetical protein
MLQNLFTDALNREQWLSVMDHLVVYNDMPWLFLLVSVAYLTHFRSTLLRMTTPEDVELFFTRANAVDGHTLMKKALSMAKQCDESKFCIAFSNNLPLSSP